MRKTHSMARVAHGLTLVGTQPITTGTHAHQVKLRLHDNIKKGGFVCHLAAWVLGKGIRKCGIHYKFTRWSKCIDGLAGLTYAERLKGS